MEGLPLVWSSQSIFADITVSRRASITDMPAIICSQPFTCGSFAVSAFTMQITEAMNDLPGT